MIVLENYLNNSTESRERRKKITNNYICKSQTSTKKNYIAKNKSMDRYVYK